MCTMNLFGSAEFFHPFSKDFPPIWVFEESTSIIASKSKFHYISDSVDEIFEVLRILIKPSVLFSFICLYVDS